MVFRFPLKTLLIITGLCMTAGCAKEAAMVRLETSKGSIVIELDEEKAPVTTENFIAYVQDGFFNDTIFHRVIPNFMIQGGGFTADMTQKKTRPAIVNEAANGLPNLRGTIAMARTSNPDSATSQFFINLADNEHLNKTASSAGYAVFGRVTEGMEVVDEIAKAKTATKGTHDDVPVETILIKSADIISGQ
jgi:cyclophilin family peptidyl-prolyl cis-trans isomerase